VARIRGAFEMLEAVRLLVEAHPLVHLEVIGGSFPAELHEELAECVRELGLETHVTLRGRMPLDRAMEIVADCDFGLALLHPDPNYLHSLPTKMFEYMALGLPVVVSDFGLWRRIVDGTAGGLTVDPLDPAAIAAAVHRLAADPDLMQRMQASGRRAVREVYSWQPEAERLLAMYAGLEREPHSVPEPPAARSAAPSEPEPEAAVGSKASVAP
jgi:glycosyltransferase involved in cell wall biosynthesis